MIQASLSFAKGLQLTVSSRHEYAPWLALTRVKGLGAVGFKKLTTQFADPTAKFSAALAELEQVEGLHRDAIDGIVAFSDWAEIDEEIDASRDAGISDCPVYRSELSGAAAHDRRSAAVSLC